MATIVDLTVPITAFPLGALLADEDAYVEIERLIPVGRGRLPFFWVSDGPTERIEFVLANQSNVESFERLTTVDDRHLYQVSWDGDIDGIVRAIAENGGVVLNGVGTRGQWEFRLRFPTHGHLTRFSNYCREHDIRFEVDGVYNPHASAATGVLTPTQLETVALAHDLGYFEVPRRATLSDLAAHFGVTEQAISQRLRRALNRLLGELRFESVGP